MISVSLFFLSLSLLCLYTHTHTHTPCLWPQPFLSCLYIEHRARCHAIVVAECASWVFAGVNASLPPWQFAAHSVSLPFSLTAEHCLRRNRGGHELSYFVMLRELHPLSAPIRCQILDGGGGYQNRTMCPRQTEEVKIVAAYWNKSVQSSKGRKKARVDLQRWSVTDGLRGVKCERSNFTCLVLSSVRIRTTFCNHAGAKGTRCATEHLPWNHHPKIRGAK